jgi:hypothetical protein
MEAFWLVALPIVMAFIAAGAVLGIKVTRRRQATRSGDLGGTVPARPLSAADARRMLWRYGVTAALVAAVLVAVGVAMAAQ